MILNFAHVVDTSFERLRNGEWFYEERHALSRVRSEVRKTHPQANHQAEITEELCAMLESALDTLGSLSRISPSRLFYQPPLRLQVNRQLIIIE